MFEYVNGTSVASPPSPGGVGGGEEFQCTPPTQSRLICNLSQIQT
jgi:hypothetical protein